MGFVQVSLGERLEIAPEQEADAPPVWCEIMRAAWSHEPEQRPTFTAVYLRLFQLSGEVLQESSHSENTRRRSKTHSGDELLRRTQSDAYTRTRSVWGRVGRLLSPGGNSTLSPGAVHELNEPLLEESAHQIDMRDPALSSSAPQLNLSSIESDCARGNEPLRTAAHY